MDDFDVLVELMIMQPSWRGNWCEGGVCGCMGCANNSGRLASMGCTKAQYERVLSESELEVPEPVQFGSLEDALKAMNEHHPVSPAVGSPPAL